MVVEGENPRHPRGNKDPYLQSFFSHGIFPLSRAGLYSPLFGPSIASVGSQLGHLPPEGASVALLRAPRRWASLQSNLIASTMPSRAPRPKKKKALNGIVVDPLHNGDRPCCRLLAETCWNDDSWLSIALRKRLCGPKPKKRKKKKKKKAESDGKAESQAVAPPEPATTTTAPDQPKSFRDRVVQNYIDEHLRPSMEPYSDDDYRISDLLAFLSDQEPATIPNSAVLQAAESIQCHRCRHHVRNMLEVDTRLSIRSQSTPLILPVPDDNAFDYIAMEEGLPPAPDTTSMTFCLTPGRGSPTSSSIEWSLRRDKVEAVVLSEADVDYLALEYGLIQSKDTLLPYDGRLSDNKLETIQRLVDDKVTSILTDFTALAHGISEQLDALSGVRNTEKNIDTRSGPILIDVDSRATALLVDMKGVLLEVTYAAQFYWGSFPPGTDHWLDPQQWMVPRLSAAWKSFFRIVDDFLKAMTAYEHNLQGIADGAGIIPQLFVSSTARKFYAELVRAKLGALGLGMRSVRNELDGQVLLPTLDGTERATQFMRVLFLHEIFQEEWSPRNQPRAPVDYAFEDLLDCLCQWTKTTHGPSLSKVSAARRNDHEKMSRILGKLQASVVDVLAGANESKQPLSSDTLLARIESRGTELVAGLDEESVLSCFEKLRIISVSIGQDSLTKWLTIRSEVDVDGTSSASRPPLPGRLFDWLFYGRQEDPEAFRCSDRDTHIRVKCIMTGLLFKWMESKCLEWRAHVAEQELLSSFSGSSTKQPQNRQSKPSKGKKNKAASSSDNVHHSAKEVLRTESLDTAVSNESADKADDTHSVSSDSEDSATWYASLIGKGGSVPRMKASKGQTEAAAAATAAAVVPTVINGKSATPAVEVPVDVAATEPDVDVPTPEAIEVDDAFSPDEDNLHQAEVAKTPAETTIDSKNGEILASEATSVEPPLESPPIESKETVEENGSKAEDGVIVTTISSKPDEVPRIPTDVPKKKRRDRKSRSRAKKTDGKSTEAASGRVNAEARPSATAESVVQPPGKEPEASPDKAAPEGVRNGTSNESRPEVGLSSAEEAANGEPSVEKQGVHQPIGVYDGDAFIPVEEFLVGRLQAVLNEKRKGDMITIL